MEHLSRCRHSKHIEWHRKFLKELDKYLITIGTASKVQQLLVSKVRAILDGNNPSQVPVDPTVADIESDQAKIGWNQLLKGCFSKCWNNHANIQPGQARKYRGRWATNVIDFIFTQWRKLWESRNQDRHGHDLTTRMQAEAHQADRELAMLLYENFETTTPQHLAWLFDTPLNTRRQWPTTAIRQWLNTWLPILEETTNPKWDPHNQENYPYRTELETG